VAQSVPPSPSPGGVAKNPRMFSVGNRGSATCHCPTFNIAVQRSGKEPGQRLSLNPCAFMLTDRDFLWGWGFLGSEIGSSQNKGARGGSDPPPPPFWVGEGGGWSGVPPPSVLELFLVPVKPWGSGAVGIQPVGRQGDPGPPAGGRTGRTDESHRRQVTDGTPAPSFNPCLNKSPPTGPQTEVQISAHGMLARHKVASIGPTARLSAHRRGSEKMFRARRCSEPRFDAYWGVNPTPSFQTMYSPGTPYFMRSENLRDASI